MDTITVLLLSLPFWAGCVAIWGILDGTLTFLGVFTTLGILWALFAAMLAL